MPNRKWTEPSPSWKNFLRLHLSESAGMDFFTIPTATFGVLNGFLVIRHRDRKLMHVNVTAHPTPEWIKQQLVEAFPFDEVPEYLHRDNDIAFGRTHTQSERSATSAESYSTTRSSSARAALDACSVSLSATTTKTALTSPSSKTHLSAARSKVQNAERSSRSRKSSVSTTSTKNVASPLKN